ncbi:hypothetical protein HanXRQr2_Chr15g0722651 [Helianthus annuus]|uniref:Transposase (putative) gypsy type domain-containing protein n=1 Tax=Helianthus annuus TaxID=4232 RepID=A0A9K3H4L2_HELAN|nr:hypothetical protein HanXRQr2_Chr15g0722651 [Helianthus annuus]
MAEEHHPEENPGEEGPLRVLKWDLGLFEQITRGFRFPSERDARYPGQHQTAADAPPRYITLFEDFFLQGNFRLPTTNFMAHILQYYGFHISQMSPPRMVRVRHFEFLCRAHDVEPTVEKFRVFYQLIRNMGFYSFGNRGAAKKILLNTPKSFHDWKQKFFFIREEVVPIAMTFRSWTDVIEKEDLAIPKKEGWYLKLNPTPNRIFGENILVAGQMSDQWPADSKDVLVLKFEDKEAHLWQVAFPAFGGSMGVHPLAAGEQYCYEEIKGYFMYPVAGAFANPPTSAEGAHIPNPRPLRTMTSAGKEIVYLSSEESVGSSNRELSSWSNIFAGVLRDLGIDPEEKKKKKTKKKKVITNDADVTSKKGGSSRAATSAADKGTLRFRQSNLEDYVITSDSLEGLSCLGEKKTGAVASKSSGSAGSRNPDAGATPSSIALDEKEEEEEEEEEEPATKLVSRKRSRETTAGASMVQKPGGVPFIGKQSNLRSLYRFSPEEAQGYHQTLKTAGRLVDKVAEKEKEKVVETAAEREKEKVSEKPIGSNRKETGAAATTAHEKARGPKVVLVTGLDQAVHEKRKGPEVEKIAQFAQPDAPLQTAKVTSTGELGSSIHKEKSAAAGGAGPGGARGFVQQSPIGPKDIVGDLCYKTYTEEAHGNAPHQDPWGLKQKDTFMEFGACRDWFLNSFPPCEVNRQWARTHDGIYQAYVVGEANTRAANHQIVREWRTMVNERADWEKYRERLVRQVELAEVKAQLFGKDKDLAAKDVEIEELKRRLQEQVDKSESLEIDLEAKKGKAASSEEARQKAEEARTIS